MNAGFPISRLTGPVLRFLLGLSAAAFLATQAWAQIAPPRSWPELKAETQARADRGAYPLTGMDKEDVHEALSRINSLDRDEWAAGWSSVAERHALAAAEAERAGRPGDARESYMKAWRFYSFARWPTTNSPGKVKAYGLALSAFRNAVRFMSPRPEVVRIPFEGKEIVGYQ